MTIKDLAAKAVEEIATALNVQPSDAQAKSVDDIVQQAIIKAVLEEQRRCVMVASNVCTANQDLAHKIQAEIRADEAALIANLSALR